MGIVSAMRCIHFPCLRGGGLRRLCPLEVCARLSDVVGALEADGPSEARSAEIASLLQAALDFIDEFENGEVQEQGMICLGKRLAVSEKSSEKGIAELLSGLLAADLPMRLVSNFGGLHFEARKALTNLFGTLLRFDGPQGLGVHTALDYVCKRGPAGLFSHLLSGHREPDVSAQCASMLQSCARYSDLAEAALAFPGLPSQLLGLALDPRLEVSCDALASLRALLLTHRSISASYVQANFHEFFGLHCVLLQSPEYMTQRQALKLLSEMLLDRSFMKVMIAYVGEAKYLRIHMELLRHDSRMLRFEAFQIVKIFVANPQRPPCVTKIFDRNRDRLLELVAALRSTKAEDQQFSRDQASVLAKLRAIRPQRQISSAHQAVAGQRRIGDPSDYVVGAEPAPLRVSVQGSGGGCGGPASAVAADSPEVTASPGPSEVPSATETSL